MNKRCVGCEFRYNGKCQLIGQPVNLDAPCVFLNTTSKAINDLIELYESKETELNTQLSQIQHMLHQLREFDSIALLREYEELAQARGPVLPHARKPDHFKLNDKVMYYNSDMLKWVQGIITRETMGDNVEIETENILYYIPKDSAAILLQSEYDWFTNADPEKYREWYKNTTGE